MITRDQQRKELRSVKLNLRLATEIRGDLRNGLVVSIATTYDTVWMAITFAFGCLMIGDRILISSSNDEVRASNGTFPSI